MSDLNVEVKSAFACEDIRQEMDGKIFAIGIQNPVLGRPKPLKDGTASSVKLHFLLSLGVQQVGDFEIRFRVRSIGGKAIGSSTRLKVQFLEVAENIPFPIGPLRIRPELDSAGFMLEQEIDGNRWKPIADWRFGDASDDIGQTGD
jgi:hypothetical protein